VRCDRYRLMRALLPTLLLMHSQLYCTGPEIRKRQTNTRVTCDRYRLMRALRITLLLMHSQTFSDQVSYRDFHNRRDRPIQVVTCDRYRLNASATYHSRADAFSTLSAGRIYHGMNRQLTAGGGLLALTPVPLTTLLYRYQYHGMDRQILLREAGCCAALSPTPFPAVQGGLRRCSLTCAVDDTPLPVPDFYMQLSMLSNRNCRTDAANRNL